MWLVKLVWGFIFVTGALTCIMRDDSFIYYCTVAAWSFNLFTVSSITISFNLLYTSPHYDLNNTVQQRMAHKLLECARRRIPRLLDEWATIDECLTTVNAYNVSNGRVPYLRPTPLQPTAFVFPDIDSHSIFVTSHFQELHVDEKALVLIHECAHIGLGAVDHAYNWERKFHSLTKEQHYENADSFMDAVMYYCLI